MLNLLINKLSAAGTLRVANSFMRIKYQNDYHTKDKEQKYTKSDTLQDCAISWHADVCEFHILENQSASTACPSLWQSAGLLQIHIISLALEATGSTLTHALYGNHWKIVFPVVYTLIDDLCHHLLYGTCWNKHVCLQYIIIIICVIQSFLLLS
jgi:hypothetical protein